MKPKLTKLERQTVFLGWSIALLILWQAVGPCDHAKEFRGLETEHQQVEAQRWPQK